MLKNNDNQNNDTELKNKQIEINFLKKVKISIFDFDKYFIIAGEKVSSTFMYLVNVFLIFSIIVGSANLIAFNNEIIKNGENSEIINSIYNQLEKSGIEISISKSDLINKLTGEQKNTYLLYMGIYLALITFIIYFITTLINILALSLLGIIITKIIRLPLRYSAIFNMSTSAMTLSIFINLIYVLINTFGSFVMEYFQVMYTLISYIYLISAILIMRSNLIKIKPIKQRKKDEYSKDDKEQNEAN